MFKLSRNQPHLAVTALIFVCALLLLDPMLIALVKPAGQTYNIAILFDVGGRGDLSFNDMAVYGAEQAKTTLAAQGYTVAITYFTPRSTADFVPTLETFSSSGTYTLIACIGFLWSDALNATALGHPSQKYMIIDSVVSAPNVASVVFTEEQSSAMVGAAAAIATQTGKVAVVLGMEIPLLWKFEIGFAYGAKWMAQKLGKSITISYYYTGTFGDPSKGQEAATTFLDQGADVIYAAAGATGLGVLQACSQRANATGKPIFSIGVDADQDYVYPGQILCSARKKVDYGVESTIEAAVKGTFASGTIVLGLKEGGVSMSTPDDMTVWADFLEGAGYTSAQIATIETNVQTMYNTYLSSHQADLDELKSEIISGDITVPVPDSSDIEILRAEYEGAFQAGIPLENILIAVGLGIVVLGVGYYVLFMRRKPTGK
jgi:basic membrane protein A